MAVPHPPQLWKGASCRPPSSPALEGSLMPSATSYRSPSPGEKADSSRHPPPGPGFKLGGWLLEKGYKRAACSPPRICALLPTGGTFVPCESAPSILSIAATNKLSRSQFSLCEVLSATVCLMSPVNPGGRDRSFIFYKERCKFSTP